MLRQLRERKNTTPVLLLSARGEVNERVEGLNAGADDYLPKPFELAELVARVRALTRRSGENKSTVLRVADLTLDTVTHRAQRGGADIELTAREYRLLEFLMRSAGPPLRTHDDSRKSLGLRFRSRHESRGRLHPAAARKN